MLRPAHLLRNEKLAAVLTENPGPLAVLICLVWTIVGLTGHDPWKPDEAYTFGIVYHLLQGSGWVVPLLAGEPFMEQPPLFYLSAALFAHVFSFAMPLHDAARLATGFFMAITFVFVGLAGKELYGRGGGWVAVLMLLGCAGLLVRAHQLITDVALLSGFSAGIYAFTIALRRPRLSGFWLGTGIGIAFMSRGMLEAGILVVIALLLLVFRQWRNRDYATSLLIAVIAAAPWLFIWPAMLYARAPELFHNWFWVQNVRRFVGLIRLRPEEQPFYYVQVLPWFAWPVWPFALWTLWRTRRELLERSEVLLPLLVFVCLFAALSISGDGREVYGLPLLLPLSLLATAQVATLPRGATNAYYWFAIMLGTVFSAVIWFYWMSLEIGIPDRLSRHMNKLQPGYATGMHPAIIGLAVLCTACWFTLVFNIKRGPTRPVTIWAAAITTLWVLVALLMVKWIDTGKTYRTMVASLVEAIPAHQCIYSQALGESQRAMLHYFAGVFTVRLENPGQRPDCDLLLEQGSWGSPGQPGGPWKKIWEGGRPGDKRERYRLFQRTLEGISVKEGAG